MISNEELRQRVCARLLASHALAPPSTIVTFYTAAACEVAALVACAGGGCDERESRRYFEDAYVRGQVFGPGLYLNEDLFDLAYPGWFDREEESAGASPNIDFP